MRAKKPTKQHERIAFPPPVDGVDGLELNPVVAADHQEAPIERQVPRPQEPARGGGGGEGRAGAPDAEGRVVDVRSGGVRPEEGNLLYHHSSLWPWIKSSFGESHHQREQ